MKLPPYIEFKVNDHLEPEMVYECIMQTEEPGYFAIISRGYDLRPTLEVIHREDEVIQVAGYEIYLWFKGSLFTRYFALINPQPKLEIREFLSQMASWYLINVIGQRPSEFERFRM